MNQQKAVSVEDFQLYFQVHKQQTYLTKPANTNRMRPQVNVLTEYNWFEFRSFFLLGLLPN